MHESFCGIIPLQFFFLCVQSETETDLHIFRRLTQTKRTNKRSVLNTPVHTSLNPALQTYLGKKSTSSKHKVLFLNNIEYN